MNGEPGLNNRIEYIDALKTFCMFLVIYCHTALIDDTSFIGNLMMSLAWVAVPCFMMSSGALLHQKTEFNWTYYLKKIASAYLGIVVWRLLYYLVYFCAGKTVVGIRAVFKYVFLLSPLEDVDTGLMWYMYAYLAMLLIYPVTYCLFKGDKLYRQVLLFIMIWALIEGYLISNFNWIMMKMTGINLGDDLVQVRTVISLGSCANMLFFFLLGALWLEYKNQIRRWLGKFSIPVYVVCLVFGMTDLVIVKYVETGLWVWGNQYLPFGYGRLGVVIMAIGLFGIFQEVKIGDHVRILSKLLGKDTLGVYYLHYILLTMFSWTEAYEYLKSHYFIGMNILKTVLVYVVCELIVVILKRIPGIRRVV